MLCDAVLVASLQGVPEAELMSSLNAPDRSLGMLMPLVDFVARINNNHPEPVLDVH